MIWLIVAWSLTTIALFPTFLAGIDWGNRHKKDKQYWIFGGTAIVLICLSLGMTLMGIITL